MLNTISLLLLWQPAHADTNDHTSAKVDRGTFDNPAARLRPRFRYWLPDAGVDVQTVQDNIKSAGAIGAGGVEFLPFYNYGGELTPAPAGSNWTRDGFGTPSFHKMFLGALEAHKEAGMVMDFPLGPNQGQGVPADYGDEGLQWDLVCTCCVDGHYLKGTLTRLFQAPFSVIVENGTFEGQIPGWGAGELVALVSAAVLSTKNISLGTSGSSIFGSSQSSYLSLVVKNGTLVDRTQNVSSTGHLSLKLPAGSSYRLFAFYQSLTREKNLDYNGNGETIWDNGSYVVDHYSPQGAEVVAKFWEKYILPGGVKGLLMEVGNYGKIVSRSY